MIKTILVYGSNRNEQREVKKALRDELNSILTECVEDEYSNGWEVIESCSYCKTYGDELLQRRIVTNVNVAFLVASQGLIGIKTAFYTGLLKATRKELDYPSPDIFIVPASDEVEQGLSEQELDNYQDLYKELKPYGICSDDGLRLLEIIRSHSY